MTDFTKEDAVVTFDGLLGDGRFIGQVDAVIKSLSDALDTPVDIEFASDGDHFYLLQCRPLSYFREADPVEIPKTAPEDLLFSTHRHISNGCVPHITHVVYVDPRGYAALQGVDEMDRVGRTVGRLNQLLPSKRFILIGPGRWGSRGDIRLGVHVTYSDINNTAMLIEVALKNGDYTPDLSFGTHFFQDLVEASIRYLPLYPDDDGAELRTGFFEDAHNLLREMIPEAADLEGVVRVIDIPRATEGKALHILMSADESRAVGVFSTPDDAVYYS